MIEKIGTCLYCHQSIMVRVPEEADEHEVRMEATKLCRCEEALALQKTEQSIACTERYIEEEITDEKVRDLLLAAARPIGEHFVDKISMKHGKTRYTMTRKNDGSIKVEKMVTNKEVNEV